MKNGTEACRKSVVPIEFGKALARKKSKCETGLHKAISGNRLNKERLRKERLEANKSVLRSYRIRRNGGNK